MRSQPLNSLPKINLKASGDFMLCGAYVNDIPPHRENRVKRFLENRPDLLFLRISPNHLKGHYAIKSEFEEEAHKAFGIDLESADEDLRGLEELKLEQKMCYNIIYWGGGKVDWDEGNKKIRFYGSSTECGRFERDMLNLFIKENLQDYTIL